MTSPDAVRVVDALPDGVVVADHHGTVRLVNRAAASYLGQDRDAAVGRPLVDVLVLRDHHGRTWCELNRPYEGLRTRTGVPEQAWMAPSGQEVLVTARLLREPPLSPVSGVAVSIRDGRGRARLDRERSDLVATVAHELRSPLTGVKGFVQAMLNRWDKLTDEQKRLMLTTVNADADRLSRLIAELLDVARIDTGRLSMYPRPVDVTTLVQRVVTTMQAGTARPIVFSAAPDTPEPLVDPDKVVQVVTNLMENALRHGGGTVRVDVAPADAALLHASATAPADGGHGAAAGHAGAVSIVVEDEGEGIPPEQRRLVFTKFWTQGRAGGSGLGMYIVHGLVRAHGGSVTIADAPGGGARIVTVWPVAAEDDPVAG